MIMDDSVSDAKSAQIDEELACAYLSLLGSALEQKRATPVAKRKESEALYYDSFEAATDEQAFELLVQATHIDPCNAAALLSLKEYFVLTLEEELMATRAIAAIAEKRLGKKVFRDCAGHFWGSLETRPYMRARGELAYLLAEANMMDEAVAEWEDLIALNTNDNQGIRYILLPLYMQHAQLDKADKLFESYPDEDELSVVFAWCRVLERLTRKDDAGAKSALGKARMQNGFAEAFILGHRHIPKDLPDNYAPGGRDEAACFAKELRAAWESHPEALKWLAAQPKQRT